MRSFSHTQKKEPLLEYLLSEMRFRKAVKYIDKNSIVADLGCGYGGSLLKRISSGIKSGVGYDVSVGKKGFPKNITLKRTDLNKNIDNRKNYFDAVTALAVLEHVENPEAFIRKIKVMLKIGGRIIITTPDKKGKKILEFLSFKLGLISKDEVVDHKTYFNKKTLKKLLKKLGFRIVKIDSFEFGLNLFCVAEKIT